MATFTAKEALVRHAVSCESAKKSKKKKNMRVKGSETSVRVVRAYSYAPSDEKQQASAEIKCPRKGCDLEFAGSELETHLSCHDAGGGSTFACPKCGAGRHFNRYFGLKTIFSA